MQWLMRIVCIAYFVFLTMLLWTSDPARLIGVHGALPRLLQVLLPVAHLISFMVLAVLALITRWSAPRWAIVVALAVYGGITEIGQNFVPSRTPDWRDWLQDVGGIAVGAALCWAIAAVGSIVRARRTQKALLSPAPDELPVVQEATQTRVAGEESWWC